MSVVGIKADLIHAQRQAGFGPFPDLGRIEIPQRSSRLPHRDVLSLSWWIRPEARVGSDRFVRDRAVPLEMPSFCLGFDHGQHPGE
jgi:hypothetical protein